jgi:putative transposase
MDRSPPGRRTLAKGVKIGSDQTTILFVTVCAQRPANWLATPPVHESLVKIWRDADTWLVGYYLLMSDHIHMFCAPRDLRFTIEAWVAYWKSQFTRQHLSSEYFWQRGLFHHRLRTADEYRDKWTYIRQNPFRKNLVASPDTLWPYSGILHDLRWSESPP